MDTIEGNLVLDTPDIIALTAKRLLASIMTNKFIRAWH